MKVILSGGGTLGSVSPLLAAAEELRKKDSSIEFLWLGTKNGPEKELVEEYNIQFKSIAAGKLRRYFSLEHILDLFKIIIGFSQSFFILKKFKPDVFVSAGAFVSLPAAMAAFILKIPILIHQQDAVAGLANKLMSALAKKITVSLDISLRDFSKEKTELVGNPVRQFIFEGDANRIKEKLELEDDLPLMLVMGGGTGAMAINELVLRALPELLKFCQLIHLTGKGKGIAHENARDTLTGVNPDGIASVRMRYHPVEFATSEVADFYAAADLVVSRAGMSALSEICALGKPAIIIPIPKSHQEKNAEYFASRGAVIILRQTPRVVIPNLVRDPQTLKRVQGDNFAVEFINLIKELLFNQSERKKLSENAKKIMPRDAAQKMAEMIQSLTVNP